MKVKMLTLVVILTAAVGLLSLPTFATELNFETTNVVGKVIDEAGQPVVNVKLEVELASNSVMRRHLNIPRVNEHISAVRKQFGSGVFLTETTGEKGEYKLNGLTIPAVYYVVVRNVDNFLPTKITVILNPSDKGEYEAQPMVLRARKGSGVALSDKAMKEIAKSKKAIEEKDIKKAIKHLQKALTLQPDYAEGYYNLAVLFMQQKNRDEAIKAMEKTLELNKDHKESLKTLGDIYFFKKDFAKAVDYHKRYLAIREKEGDLAMEDVNLYFQIVKALHAQKKSEEARVVTLKYLELKKKVASLDEKDAMILNDIGSFYYGKNDMKKAIVYFSMAVEASDKLPSETYMYLGNCFLTKRDGKNAIKYYRVYLEKDPKGKHVGQVKSLVDKLSKMYSPEEEKKK
jgi:tetratricopeptide (TPR) repeat protein